MAKNYSSTVDTSNFISIIIIILFLCIGFIPNLEAVDKIAPQWLSMSIINLISLSYISINYKKFGNTLNYNLRTPISIIYLLFILWGGASYFYAINSTEVLVNIARQVNIFLMFVNMSILLYKIKSKAIFISYFILIILSIEVYAVLDQATEMIKNFGAISSGSLKGVTANRNITAFSIAIKIPFILFIIYQSKRFIVNLFGGGLIFLSFLALSMIQSRAAFLAIGLLFFSFIILNTVLYFKNSRNKRFLILNAYIILPLFFAVIVNQSFYSDKGADAISRAATISFKTNDGSVNQRLRYYEDVFKHVSSNPVLGVGLGNWKLKSIEYDNRDITGYIVPYHAHSDFIQLGAELGVIGFFLYLGVFVLTVFYGFKIIFKFK